MRHLLSITSTAFVQAIQKQLSGLDFWSDGKESAKVRENLRNSVNVCDRWCTGVEQMTSFYWKNYPGHPWKGEAYRATYLVQFKVRLSEIMTVRSSYDQAIRFNPSLAKENLTASRVFSPFSNLNPIQFSPYTDEQWKAAIDEYETSMANIDRQLGQELLNHLKGLHANRSQMLVELKRCSDLIKRKSIRKEISSELEFVYSLFKEDITKLDKEFEELASGRKKSSNTKTQRTTIGTILDGTRQIEAKVNSTSISMIIVDASNF